MRLPRSLRSLAMTESQPVIERSRDRRGDVAISSYPQPYPLSSYAILNFVRKTSWLILGLLPLLVLICLWAPGPAQAGPNPQATIVKSIFIQSPREGQALQGVEILEGKIRGEGLLKGTIHFSYSDSPAPERTWFYIGDIEGENQDSSQTAFQVEWDTTQITDGDYDLRVVAEYSGGAAIFELVPNLRIRNHSPVETATPAPLAGRDGAAFTAA